jgi:hypothetical protein
MFTKINYPDPHNPGMRLVGWRVPEATAGLSNAIFWLEGIERAYKVFPFHEAVYTIRTNFHDDQSRDRR